MAPTEMYDVIVVGAGASGAPVAARVSEDPNRSVLLVEAGPDYASIDKLPDDLRNGNKNSVVDHDWGLQYAPTPTQPGEPLPRGRVIGGSSAVNTCIFLRGVPEDYDDWAARGCPEWGWDNVLPAFRRIERDLDYGDADHHGDSGPMPVRRAPHHEMIDCHQAWLASAEELGYPRLDDQNDPDGWGAGPQPMNKLGGLRVSTATAYLAPARPRPNLTVRSDSHTVRVVVEGGRATGVEVIRPDGETATINGRLVVLCAGAIATPGILLRSGIGPRDDLARLGVEEIADVSAVGNHLSDHPAQSVVCRPVDLALADQDQPIIQTILRYTAPDSGYRNDLQIELLTFVGRLNQANFAVAAILEQVHGTGSVHYPTADPLAKPVIDSRFCEDDRDAQRLADCFLDAVRFTEVGPLADLVDEIVFPDMSRIDGRDDLIELFRRASFSGYHPCGTARMGAADDPDTVVDQYGRCHAVDGLVVADASIMPTVPRANTNPTSIMIGDMIGEWIRTHPGRYGL